MLDSSGASGFYQLRLPGQAPSVMRSPPGLRTLLLLVSTIVLLTSSSKVVGLVSILQITMTTSMPRETKRPTRVKLVTEWLDSHCTW